MKIHQKKTAMKKYKLHRDLTEALVITLGILIAFTALAFTTIKKESGTKPKDNQVQAFKQLADFDYKKSIFSENSAENTINEKVRIYDEEGNLLSEMDKTSENEKNLLKDAKLVMSLDGVEYYVLLR
ncbi:MAG: hypothetical protein OHK0038_22610 [Flammeovirgaceae bacterium]